MAFHTSRVAPASSFRIATAHANARGFGLAYTLEKSYGAERLEAACQRALLLETRRYKSVESILKHGLDKTKPAPDTEPLLPDDHDNIRGPSYYH